MLMKRKIHKNNENLKYDLNLINFSCSVLITRL